MADKAVGVVFGRQKQERQGFVVFELRQGVFQRAPCGFAASRVAVETEINVVGLAEQEFDVLGGGGRAQRGNGIAHAELRQCHHVHIAFHHQNAARVFHRLARFVQTVQVFALVEQGRVGRIEVFGFGIVQHAAAKADDLPRNIADGEHDAVAEAVVLAAFVVQHHAAVYQRCARIRLKHLGQWRPAFGRVADAVMRDDFGRQAASRHILPCLRRTRQLLLVKRAGCLHHLFQRLLLLFFGGTLGGGLRIFLADIGHAHAHAVGQKLHGFDKAQTLVLHHKADGRPVRTAAEAMVKLLAGAHGKAGRFFFVERAARHVVRPALFQRNVLVDHIDNIGFGQQVVNEVLGNHKAETGNKGNGLFGQCAGCLRLTRHKSSLHLRHTAARLNLSTR